ncbi:hypothetical protein C3D70_02220 [Cronobacter sakazakii]|nr:hypothetical protein [Cronobacter sakazakii]EGT5764616.1 hypothetical protein [Cronobacter sakazakii]PPX88629.1 hypothetical protein C3D70_02220 [Cronobacter sakazakii]
MNSPGFPVCKPGRYYLRSASQRELTCGKKAPEKANVFLLILFYAFFGKASSQFLVSRGQPLCHYPLILLLMLIKNFILVIRR